MPKRLRPIGHDDRLSVVDHLDELRSRLFVCLGWIVVAFGVCFWQSGRLLNLLNRPLNHLQKAAKDHILGTASNEVDARHHLLKASADAVKIAHNHATPSSLQGLYGSFANQLHQAATSLPAHTPGIVPITTQLAEPFTTSLEVAFYFGLVIASPVLLYQAFAYIVPALSDRERAVIRPILFAAPILFFGGVVFTYLIVLPAAIKFLQGYNGSHYNSLIQASPLYSFEVLTMAGIGLAFEMPIILLGLRAIGVINGSTLTRHWRIATVGIAVIGAAMPGADPVTTGLETAPLAILFVASIFLLKWADRREAKREAAEPPADDPTIGIS